MKKTVAAGLGVCAIALAFAAKDPVIMTVNGEQVPKSEFEYLYHKNSQQQINPQTLDEYVEMFKLYKMKVADAKAARLDTLPSFLKESVQYRHELAAPYIADSVFLNKLVDEAYDRTQSEVEVSHLMLFKTRDPKVNAELRQRIDSLQKVAAAGADFNELVANYSQDRGSNTHGGSMGYISAGRFPILFEETAYALKDGEISKVVESPQGYHILKGGKKRPARGKVQVSHILRLTSGKDEEGQEAAHQMIDSLYNVVMADPNSFDQIAMRFSEDPGSARQGGVLPLFGSGEMVPEFEQASFDLKDGEISQPIKTSYGYHIIKKIKSEPIPSKISMKAGLLSTMTSPRDARYNRIRAHQIARFAKKHKGSLNAAAVEQLRKEVETVGLDSALFADYTTIPAKAGKTLCSVEGKNYTVGDFLSGINKLRLPASQNALDALNDNLDAFYYDKLVNAEEERLLKDEPDYRNLLKEYVDGTLLYEASVRNVWDKPSKDAAGLEQYFNEHRDNYKWQEPRAKGFLVQATNDSVMNLILDRAVSLTPAEMISTLKNEFKNDIAIDRILVQKGTNPMVDNIIFGGPKVTPSSKKLTVYNVINPRVILEPEEVLDVKGLVTNDYQNLLQQQWENELRAKYPVIVDDKVLKTVKPIK